MISIVIPVHNDPQALSKCVKAVLRSTYLAYECIVVDDGSGDETLAVAQRFPIKVLKFAQSYGPACARNRGAQAAAGEILLFIDADVQIYSDTLAKIAETFAHHPEIAAVIGSYDDDPDDASFISQYKNLFHHYVHQRAREDTNTFWAACGAIRRELFMKVGGFNELYGKPAIEDIELGYRLTMNNHKILLHKQIQVKHLKRWTFWRLLKTDVFHRGVPWTELMLRERIFPNDLNLRSSQCLCVILVYLFLISSLLIAVFFRKEASLTYFLLLPLGLGSILMLNTQFYKFFIEKRNLVFALKVFPLHLLYYFYCGLSVFFGILSYIYKKANKTLQRKWYPNYLNSQDHIHAHHF